jgi:hypothetical protein
VLKDHVVKPCHGWKRLERIEEKKERRRRGSREKGEQFFPNPTLEREREKDYEDIWPQNN